MGFARVGSNPADVANFLAKRGQGGIEPPTSRTRSENHTTRPLAQYNTVGKKMSPEGFEPPAFGSGIQRAAVAPWAQCCLTVGAKNTPARDRTGDLSRVRRAS
jgi:hypothetical protein